MSVASDTEKESYMRFCPPALLACLLGLTHSAHAQLPPLDCPAANQWNFIPLVVSSERFPWASEVVYSTNEWDRRYQHNKDYSWQIWFSGNVTRAQFLFEKGTAPVPGLSPGQPGFETEWIYDKLIFRGAGPPLVLYGALDDNHQVEYRTATVQPEFVFSNDNYVEARWVSDYSNSYRGWRTKGVYVWCDRTGEPAGVASNISRLHANDERNGVLLGTGDIRYFSTVQVAGKEMVIHLKPDESVMQDYDFDLYADVGGNQYPRPGAAQWYSKFGVSAGRMTEDYLIIPAPAQDRYVYFSVYSHSGSGGYKVYENTIAKTFEFKIGLDFDLSTYNNNCIGGDCLEWIKKLLGAAAGGMYQAVDGTGRVVRWRIYNSDWRCGGGEFPACHMVLWSSASCTGFSGALCIAGGACDFQNPSEYISNCNWNADPSPTSQGMTLAHEFGHCLYGFDDEYNKNLAIPGFRCGHTIMNGTTGTTNVQDYCTGRESTFEPSHLLDSLTPDQSPQHDRGNWQEAQICFPDQFTTWFVTHTPDPERWADSPIWAREASAASNSPPLLEFVVQ